MAKKVNDPTDAVIAMQSDLAKVETLMGGTASMRAAGAKYLPQWPKEDAESYKYRLQTSTLFNAFARAIENMASKPFSEDLTWTKIDPSVEEWFDDIDLSGRNIQVFSKEVFQLGLRDGLTHILVDFPVTRGDDGKPALLTKAAEIAAGVRPYVISIPQSQMIGWKSTTTNGVQSLTQLRIMESVEEPDGDFGTKKVQQVRVLTPGAWGIYRKVTTVNVPGESWELFDSGTTTLNFIPLVTFYARRTGFMIGKPPLNDLADLNIKHWQSSSDQDSILHVARVPILALIGLDDEKKLVISSKTALCLPTGCDAKYVEHSGAAIEAGRDSLKDLEGQMESMGAELLTAPTIETTATENAIDAKSARCQLSAMVQSMEDTLDQVVDIMAAWAGLGEQGDIDIFDDFAVLNVDATTAAPFVASLISLVEGGLLSKESAFNEMKRYGILNPDLVWTQELLKIPVADQNKPLPTPIVTV